MPALMLFASLFGLFFCLTARELPEPEAVRAWLFGKGLAAASALGCFAAASALWGVPAGIPWAALGWRLPEWAREIRSTKRRAKLSAAARDFVTAAAGMYAAGLTTPEVLRRLAERLPEPLGPELERMAARRELAGQPVPAMFAEVARRYGLAEFSAVARIVAASERAGGPQAASRGLKRLAQALRQKERLAAERAKATIEPRIAAVVTVAVLGAGLLLDGTILRPYFAGGGRLVLAAASALVVGMLFLLRKISRSEDLA
ncbi:MAG: type II secretion system F family protein [Firmicutes bacterium]|nr:type II secretion system F family protein [Bacillota bacterium]